MSPHGNLIAILTSHTVRVAVLPDPSHLRGPDTGPIRLKTYTVGPTCHVLSQPPVVSAVWHPLGVLGTSLVTVTTNAIVRVWDFSLENRWSFDSPGLVVDLKRLADGLPPDQNLAQSKLSANKGFSPDSFEMEVAAACFGGLHSEDQYAWAPMTLWIAMREGDVYALCPLLPAKWSPPSTLIPSLSVSITSNITSSQKDPSASKDRRTTLQKQLQWIRNIDGQEPLMKSPDLESGLETVIYSRPEKPGPLPRLQGPFQLDLLPEEDEPEVDTLLTDIYAVGAKLDSEQSYTDEDAEPDLGLDDPERLSMGVLCLLTNKGRAHVVLDVEGVEGQWLSEKEVCYSVSNFIQHSG